MGKAEDERRRSQQTRGQRNLALSPLSTTGLSLLSRRNYRSLDGTMPGHGGGGELPTVKFTVVEPAATVPPDAGNPQLAAYGYNDGKEWSAYQDTVAHGDGGRYLRWLREFRRVVV